MTDSPIRFLIVDDIAENIMALEALLRERAVERLVVLGLATDYCVRATALDGRALGWPVVVRWDGVRAVDLQPGDGERAREELLAAGVEIA